MIYLWESAMQDGVTFNSNVVITVQWCGGIFAGFHFGLEEGHTLAYHVLP